MYVPSFGAMVLIYYDWYVFVVVAVVAVVAVVVVVAVGAVVVVVLVVVVFCWRRKKQNTERVPYSLHLFLFNTPWF